MSTQSSPWIAFQTSEASRGSMIGLASQSSFACSAHFARRACVFAETSAMRAFTLARSFPSLARRAFKSAVSIGMASVVSAITRSSAWFMRW